MSAAGSTAALCIIGNEILSGRTQDANLQFIGTRLAGLGIELREVRVVADDEPDIVTAVNALRARYTYVFTSGGIGPTHDDITTACIARAFGVPVERNPDAVQRLSAWYSGELSDARLQMANIPRGAVLIDNPVSAAPGFRLDNVFVFAGIPKILQAMFDGIAHTLVGGPPFRSLAVSVRFAESRLANGLRAVQDRYPDVPLGSYPFARSDGIGTTLVARSNDPQKLAAAFAEVQVMLDGLGAPRID